MVSESSIQIVMFASPVSLRMVLLMFWSICMRVERRRWPQTQTSSLPAVFQLVSLLPQALPASLLLSVSLPEPQRLSVGRRTGRPRGRHPRREHLACHRSEMLPHVGQLFHDARHCRVGVATRHFSQAGPHGVQRVGVSVGDVLHEPVQPAG